MRFVSPFRVLKIQWLSAVTALLLMLGSTRAIPAAQLKTYAYREMGISFSHPEDWRVSRSQGARNHDDSLGISVDRLQDPRANGGVVEAMIFIFTEKSGNRSLAQRAEKDVPSSDPKDV